MVSSAFLCFQWLPSVGNPRMTPVAYFQTKNLYEVSLVNINRKTPYISGILRQYYGIIRQEYGIIRGVPFVSSFGITDRNGRN